MTCTEELVGVPGPIEGAGRRIKRYHVIADPADIDPEIEKAACAILPEILPGPDETPLAAFVSLHRNGDDETYLNVLAPGPNLEGHLADPPPEATTGDRS